MENSNELKNGLGIDEWLELIKEDKNLNGAYISIAQYIYLIEKENQETKELLHKIMASGVEEKSTPVLELYKENQELFDKNKRLKNQLEEARQKNSEYSYKLCHFRCEETYENQQKEFISYMKGCKMKRNKLLLIALSTMLISCGGTSSSETSSNSSS